MLEKNIFRLITDRYADLTKAERKVADFVFSNKHDVQYMPIATFAEDCEVGEATVFRFCKSLSLDGYNEFKLAVARALTQGQMYGSISNDEILVNGKVLPSDSFSDMCKKLYSSQVSALAQTIELATEDRFVTAAKYLSKARRVFCLGQGNSLVLAMIAWSRFISISKKFCFVEDAHLQATNIALCDSDDVVLFFSYSGATKEILEVLPTAKQNGSKIILITRFENSEAAQLADVVLLCGSNEGPLQVGSIAAKAAQLMVIDILYNEYWLQNEKECEENAQKTAQIISKKLV